MLGMVLRLPEGSGKKARFEAFKGQSFLFYPPFFSLLSFASLYLTLIIFFMNWRVATVNDICFSKNSSSPIAEIL